MTEAVIVAILSLIGTGLGSFGGAFGGLKLMSYRIEQLEKKVDKHNNFAERLPVLEEKIEVSNHRLENLEKKVI